MDKKLKKDEKKVELIDRKTAMRWLAFGGVGLVVLGLIVDFVAALTAVVGATGVVFAFWLRSMEQKGVKK